MLATCRTPEAQTLLGPTQITQLETAEVLVETPAGLWDIRNGYVEQCGEEKEEGPAARLRY